MPKVAKLSPKSWLQNSTLTPVEAASMNVSSNAVLAAWSSSSSPGTSSQELLTTEAPLVIAVVSAASRLLSKQSWAPTYMMCAPGAIACEDCTSSACSVNQPLPAHWSWASPSGGTTLVNWDDFSGCDGSFSLKYRCESD